jgi:hypothetical protein
MALDSYLSVRHLIKDPAHFKALTAGLEFPVITTVGNYVCVEIAYWHKASFIHEFFLEATGVEFQEVVVNRELLHTLLNRCVLARDFGTRGYNIPYLTNILPNPNLLNYVSTYDDRFYRAAAYTICTLSSVLDNPAFADPGWEFVYRGSF